MISFNFNKWPSGTGSAGAGGYMEYSEKEMMLIKYFGYADICEGIPPPVMYRMMMEKAFCLDIKGDATESLRRCMNAIAKCKIYRMTKQWDDLIVI